MSRRIRSFVLFCTVLWQAIALAAPVLDSDVATSWLHSALHAQYVDHHHHHDGAVHLDDSNGKFVHTHAEHDLNSAGLLLDPWTQATPVRSLLESALLFIGCPSPSLDGLYRPPRLT